MMADIREIVRQFIDDNFIMGSQQSAFAANASFMAHHIIDSTGFLELITFIEERFGIVVEEDEMLPENLDSLDAVHAYVTRKMETAGTTVS